MLERASSSAECTAILISRVFEQPIRTRKVLDPKFWRHRSSCSEPPVWWSVYLDSIRKKSATYSVFSDDLVSQSSLRKNSQRPASTSPTHHVRPVKARAARYHRCSPPRPNLPILQSAAFHQEALATLPKLEGAGFEKTEDHSANIVQNNASSRPAITHGVARERVYQSSAYNIKQEKRNGFAQGDNSTSRSENVENHTDKFQNTWELFTQSGQKGDLAAGVLEILAQSDNSITLTRALVAYETIRPEARTQADFDVATDVATRLRQYNIAIQIIKEAVQRNLGGDALFRFIAYCIDKALWVTVSKLWRSVGHKRIRRVRRADRPSKSETFTWAGRFAHYFENIQNFPERVVALAERLANGDPVLAARKQDLNIICMQMAVAAVQSPNAMRLITADTCLAILRIHSQLGSHESVHIAALSTINRIRDSTPKSQLAFLIYQDYKSRNQDAKIPRFVFGILINVARDDRQPPSAYDFVLDELEKTWGEVDEWSFQQILAALASQGQVKALHGIFEKYLTRYRPNNLRDVVHLLHVYAVSGDSEGAQMQFNNIKSRFRFTHNVVSWTILLLAHARSPHPETAFQVFKDMQKAKIVPNHMSWSILMSVAARRGDIDQVQKLYEKASALKIPSSMHMVGAVIEALLLNDKPQEAETWAARATQQSPDKSTIRLWNSLLRYHAFKADSTAIHRLQKVMKQHGIAPDAMTYAAIMTLLVVQRRTMDACRVLRRLYSIENIRPSEFHYSILIHGFVMEQKHDMAIFIYREMLERFPKPTPSAKLAMLHLQLHRDSDVATRLAGFPPMPNKPMQVMDATSSQRRQSAMDYVAETLLHDPAIEAAFAGPSPGFGRMTSRDGLEAIYYWSIVRFLQSKGEASQLALTSESLDRLASDARTSPELKIQALSSIMNVRIGQQEWKAVDSIWATMLSIAKSSSAPLAEGSQVFANTSAPSLVPTESQSLADDGACGSHPMPEGNISLQGGGDEKYFTTMLPRHFHANEAANKVLPARRFVLSKPLSLYMQTLGDQARFHDLIGLVQDTRAVGFQLSNQNWNKYIQILTRSPNPLHQLLAFRTFERFLISYAPGWKLTKRGLWAVPRHFQKRRTKYQFFLPGVHQRRRIERLHPSINMPSYYTMVHLAMAMIRMRNLSLDGEGQFEQALMKNARRTMKLLHRMPYSADRVQGLLVRGRDLRGDPEPIAKVGGAAKRVTKLRTGHRLLDMVPTDLLAEIRDLASIASKIRVESGLPNNQQIESSRTNEQFFQDLAEAKFGRVSEESLSLIPEAGRESKDERFQRISLAKEDKLRRLVALSERVSGKIDRNCQHLSKLGRDETTKENQARVKRDEMTKLTLLCNMLKAVQAVSPIDDLNYNRTMLTTPNPNVQHGESRDLASPTSFSDFLKKAKTPRGPDDDSESAQVTDTGHELGPAINEHSSFTLSSIARALTKKHTAPAAASHAPHEAVEMSVKDQERLERIEAWKATAAIEMQAYVKSIAAQHPQLSARRVRSLARKRQRAEYYRLKSAALPNDVHPSTRSSPLEEARGPVRHRSNLRLRKSLREAVMWRTFRGSKHSIQ